MAKRRLDIVVKGEDRNATALFRKLDRSMASLGKHMKSLAVGFATFFGGRALIRGFNQTRMEIDKLAKAADRFGTTTEILSKMGFVAGQSGIQLRTMMMALQRLTRRAGEAAQGTGEAQETIRLLGIDAAKFIELDLDKQMFILADAFAEVENPAIKLTRAFKLFDSEGAVMVQILNRGSDGLREMFRQAEALGIVVNSKMAKDFEDLNDTLDVTGKLFDGIQILIVKSLAPVMKTFAEGIIFAFTSVEQVIANMPLVFELAVAKMILIAHDLREALFDVGGRVGKALGFGALAPKPRAYLNTPDGGEVPIGEVTGAARAAERAGLVRNIERIEAIIAEKIAEVFNRRLGKAFAFGAISNFDLGDGAALDPSGSGRSGGTGPFGIGVRAPQSRFLTGAGVFLQRPPLLQAAKTAEAQRKRLTELEFKQLESLERISGTLEEMRGDRVTTVTF